MTIDIDKNNNQNLVDKKTIGQDNIIERPYVYDEDNPILTMEQLKKFHRVNPVSVN